MGAWLKGDRYRLLRALVLVLALITVAQYLVGIPLYYHGLVGGCLHNNCEYELTVTPSAEEVASLGLTVPVYSLLLVTIEVWTALVFFGVAALLYWRAPNNRVALLGALCLVAGGASYSGPLVALSTAVPVFRWPTGVLSVVADAALFLFLMVFPTGHFVPRQMRWVWVTVAGLALLLEVFPDAGMTENLWLLLAALAGLIALLLSPVFAQVYRYRRVSTLAEREQTKWVVFGVSVALVSLVTVIMAGSLYEPEQVAVWGLVYHLAYHGSTVLVPLALLGAILNSRLWSIDVIIRRTLIYTLLTAALAALYLVAVIVLQAVVTVLTGEGGSTLVTVLSTLAIAALFSPLRGWLQRAVDRRFYRRKYDALETVAAFAQTARAEVDLEQLTTGLVGVVESTLQPEEVFLWLKPVQHEMDESGDFR